MLKFLPKTERYEGFWENTREKVRLPRICVLFDEEDPRIFARRFKAAYQKRIHADALIKYNYYVENMPKHQIPEIDGNQVNRVLGMTQNTKALRGKSSADTTTLLNEVNVDFAKTMNNIIFDKHCSEKNNNLITGKLELPPPKEKKISAYYGMIKIPPHNFAKKFSKFSFNTLQYKDEVIRAQQDIRKECNEVAQKDIYNLSITKALSVDEFKQY
jgi:dynein heavy chain